METQEGGEGGVPRQIQGQSQTKYRFSYKEWAKETLATFYARFNQQQSEITRLKINIIKNS